MNKNAKISMILGIVGGVLSLFMPMATVSAVILLAIGVAAIIFYVLAKKELKKLKDGGKGKGKGQATAGLVLGIISVVMGLMVFLLFYIFSDPEISSTIYCPLEMGLASDCVDNGDGKTATCQYMGSVDMQCNIDVLDESQYK